MCAHVRRDLSTPLSARSLHYANCAGYSITHSPQTSASFGCGRNTSANFDGRRQGSPSFNSGSYSRADFEGTSNSRAGLEGRSTDLEGTSADTSGNSAGGPCSHTNRSQDHPALSTKDGGSCQCETLSRKLLCCEVRSSANDSALRVANDGTVQSRLSSTCDEPHDCAELCFSSKVCNPSNGCCQSDHRLPICFAPCTHVRRAAPTNL